MPDGVCNPVRDIDAAENIASGVASSHAGRGCKFSCRTGLQVLMPDGVCNPVRDIDAAENIASGSKARPADEKDSVRQEKQTDSIKLS